MFSDEEIIIDVKSLSKRYEIYNKPRDRLKQIIFPSLHQIAGRLTQPFRKPNLTLPRKYFREFWALHNVSFRVHRGETVGIVGLNGSGKSTLLQLICSTLTPTSGNVEVKGRVAALLELGSGFNPDYTGRENVFLNGQILGLSREEIQTRFQSIVEFADIGDFIDQPVKTYSSGMTVRLAFAVAINAQPEILVVDEALAVGDLAFQRKCLAWMESFAAKRGVLLFVSHSPEQIRKLCTKAVYLRQGVIVNFGPAKEICDQYERDLHVAPMKDSQDIEDPILRMLAGGGGSNSAEYKDLDFTPPGFPACAVHYGDRRARITGAWVEDISGAVRQSFQVGESFRWCFKIEFHSFIESPIFGFMVKTKEGINLYSANSQSLGYETLSMAIGSAMIVRFFVQSNLGAGEYFLNCGVSTNTHAQPEFLHRVVDSGIITFSDIAGSSVGIVHMNTQMHMNSVDAALRG